MTPPTIQSMCDLWRSQDRPPFKGELIADDGCCCAQGQVLRCSGYTDDQLRDLNQDVADQEVAKLLDISIPHSILLREVNDMLDGSPQDVLEHPEKILGEHAQLVLAFWRYTDQVDWSTIVIDDAGDYSGSAAFGDPDPDSDSDPDFGDIAYSVRLAVRTAVRTAASSTIDADNYRDAVLPALYAMYEIQEHEKLGTELFFLPIFGINSIEELKAMVKT